VELIDDNDAMSTDPSGKELIVISSSSGSANVGTQFTEEEMCGCRCFLPDLTGFADFRCGGPGRRRTRGVPPTGRSRDTKGDIVREPGGIFKDGSGSEARRSVTRRRRPALQRPASGNASRFPSQGRPGGARR